MPFKRGDVVLALFPDSNVRTAKRRPVLATVLEGELDRAIGRLADMQAVDSALRHTLGR